MYPRKRLHKGDYYKLSVAVFAGGIIAGAVTSSFTLAVGVWAVASLIKVVGILTHV